MLLDIWLAELAELLRQGGYVDGDTPLYFLSGPAMYAAEVAGHLRLPGAH